MSFECQDLLESKKEKNDFSATNPYARLFEIGEILAEGETRLHAIVRITESVAEIQDLISEMGEEVVSLMARTSNNSGELPLDILTERRESFSSSELALQLLVDLTIVRGEFDYISSFLNFNVVIDKYNIKDSSLFESIKSGCMAINSAREIVKYSDTHIDFNNKDSEYKNRVKDLIDEHRRIVSKRRFFPPSDNTDIKLNYDVSLRYQTGNCAEFSFVCMIILIKNGYDKSVEIFEVENGDHVFLVLDSCLVCDAWAGKIFPISAIESEMMCHQAIYDYSNYRYLNSLVAFNPNFHSVVKYDAEIIYFAYRKLKNVLKKQFKDDEVGCSLQVKNILADIDDIVNNEMLGDFDKIASFLDIVSLEISRETSATNSREMGLFLFSSERPAKLKLTRALNEFKSYLRENGIYLANRTESSFEEEATSQLELY